MMQAQRLSAVIVTLGLVACNQGNSEPKPAEAPPAHENAKPPPTNEVEARKPLGVGTPAPDFSLEAHDGSTVELASIKGPVILYFYPKDETPGCTAEAEAFRDIHDQLNQIDAKVIGVSMDSLESHRGFAEGHQLTFPLLSDPKGELAAKYGVPTRPEFIERVTFVIGADKKIAAVFANIPATEHVGKAVAALGRAGAAPTTAPE